MARSGQHALSLELLKDVAAINIAQPKDTASLAVGSAVSFVSTLPTQMKADVLNSTLFAQLAANQHLAAKERNRQHHPEEWYDYYKFVLQKLGYNVDNSDFGLQRVDQSDDFKACSRVSELVLKLALRDLTKKEKKLQRKIITALNSSLTTTPSPLDDFDCESSGAAREANFQIGIASLGGNGNVQLKLSAYHYVATQRINSVLFYEYKTVDSVSISKFQSVHHTLELDDKVYSQIRARVLEQLRQNGFTDRVSEIMLPE